MGLMVVGVVVQALHMTEEVSEAHYQVVMETSKKLIEKELRGVEVASLNDAVEVQRHLSSRGRLRDTGAQPSSEHGRSRLFRSLRAWLLRRRRSLVLCQCLLGWQEHREAAHRLATAGLSAAQMV